MNIEKRTPAALPRTAVRVLRSWVWLGLSVTVVLGTLVGCTRTAAQPGPPPPPKVTVAAVLDRPVTEWDEFTGRLEAVDAVAVRPRVSGYVSSVRFDDGRFQCDNLAGFQADLDRLFISG